MYTVEWTQLALSRLTELLTELSLAEWKNLTDTIDVLDEGLRTAPKHLGESRDGYQRIVFVGRLIVLFEVTEADRRVMVLSVSWLSERGK